MRRTRLRAWVATWPDILLATAVACVAWWVAESLVGHRGPTFAATAAIVCLAPGVASRGRQAVGFVLGVAVGTGIGIAELRAFGTRDSLWVAALAAPAMAVSAILGSSAITTIQAGATALLLATGGNASAGARLVDAAIGAGLSLLVSQVLLSPNPVRLVEARLGQMFRSLAAGFAEAAEKGAAFDPRELDEAMRHATDVTAALEQARGLERWTVRGRLSRAGVARLVDRYDREAVRLCASALIFGEALALSPWPLSSELVEALRAASAACGSLARGKAATVAPYAPEAGGDAERAFVGVVRALAALTNAAGAT